MLLLLAALPLAGAAPDSHEEAAQDPVPAVEPGEDPEAGFVRPELPEKKASEAADLEEEIRALRQQGDYAKALVAAKKLLRIRRRFQARWITPEGPREWWETADARRLVETLQRFARLSAADRRKLARADQLDEETARTLAEKRHGDAEVLLREQVGIRRELLGAEHAEVALCVHRQGVVRSRTGWREEAESQYRQAIAMRRGVLGDVHPQVAESLHALASLISYPTQRYTEAEPLEGEAWRIRMWLFGEENPTALEYMSFYANLVYLRSPSASEPLYLRLLALQGRLHGSESAEVADAMTMLAALHRKTGRPDTAVEYAEGALRIYGGMPEARRDTALAHLVLASIHLLRDDLVGAERSCRESLADIRSAYPTGSWIEVLDLRVLGQVRQRELDHLAAEETYREALKTARSVWDGNLHVARALTSLGDVLLALGDHAGAEPAYREALELHRKLQGERGPGTVQLQMKVAEACFARGDLPEALERYRDVLDRAHSLPDNDSIWVPLAPQGGRYWEPLAHLNVARALLALDEPDAARAHCDSARAMLEGVPSWLVAEARHVNAWLREVRGELEEAERLYREALELRRAALPDGHPDIACSLHALARVQYLRGDLDRAERGFREALDLRLRVCGPMHPHVAESLEGLADVHYVQGNLAAARARLAEALDIMEILRPQVAGAELEGAAYAGKLGLPHAAAEYARLMVRRKRPERALEALERGRARSILDLMARSEVDVLAQARRSADPDALVRLEAALATERAGEERVQEAESALFAIQARSDLGPDERQRMAIDQVESIKEARRRQGEAAAAVMAELRGMYPEGRPASPSAIRDALGEGELLLAFAWLDEALVLLVARSRQGWETGDDSIEGHLLAEGEKALDRLDGLAALLRSELSHKPAAGPDRGEVPDPVEDVGSTSRAIQASNELFRALLPPAVWEQVKAARRVVVLPDGPLNGIPMEALVVEPAASWGSARTLLDEGPPLAYFPSGSLLVDRIGIRDAQLARGPAGISALVLADPNFEGHPSTARLPGEPLGAPGVHPGSEAGFDDPSVIDLIRLYGGRLAPLPGTRIEAAAISVSVKAAGGEVVLLTGGGATRRKLEEHLDGKQLLHLATHGLMGSVARPYDASLALTPPGAPTPEDIGFLRLEDLIRSWRSRLSDCELVVLSACETQRGIRIGDSRMALPVGFFYAGAPAVVASLWKVDDRSAARLMAGFYERMLDGRHTSKLSAFTQARKAMREGYGHPFYWAPFVFLGDPR